MKKNKKLSDIVGKRCWKLLILGQLFLLSLPVQGLAADFFVATNGNNSNDCQTALTPCLTINGAVGKASASDIIRIGPGTYNEYISLNKSLSLIGTGTDKTFLDGGGTSRVMAISTATTVSLEKLTIQNGVTPSSGGGIATSGILSLDQVEIINCSGDLGGAINNGGAGAIATISNSTIRNNNTLRGGSAIFNSAQVTIENTTISSNSAPATKSLLHNQGGGTMDMTNVTVSSNTTDIILVNVAGSAVNILNSTISNNSGQIWNYGVMYCQNTIFSGNNSSGNGNTCGSALSTLGNNLEDNNSCGLNGTGDLVNTDPLLLPLAYYGGYTKTHALDRESPVIDSGYNASCPSTDQRGEKRPFDGDTDGTATCDMGAFELSKIDLASPWTLFLTPIINKPKP